MWVRSVKRVVNFGSLFIIFFFWFALTYYQSIKSRKVRLPFRFFLFVLSFWIYDFWGEIGQRYFRIYEGTIGVLALLLLHLLDFLLISFV